MKIKSISATHVNKEKIFGGRVHRVRKGKNIIFLEIYDQSIFNLLNVLIRNDSPQLFKQAQTV